MAGANSTGPGVYGGAKDQQDDGAPGCCAGCVILWYPIHNLPSPSMPSFVLMPISSISLFPHPRLLHPCFPCRLSVLTNVPAGLLSLSIDIPLFYSISIHSLGTLIPLDYKICIYRFETLITGLHPLGSLSISCWLAQRGFNWSRCRTAENEKIRPARRARFECAKFIGPGSTAKKTASIRSQSLQGNMWTSQECPELGEMNMYTRFPDIIHWANGRRRKTTVITSR